MKHTKLFVVGLAALLSTGALAGCGNNGSEYDESGRLILKLKNVYFDTWDGTDTYTEMLNEKFNVKITPSNYDYENWDEMVNTAINGNNLTDVIHFNLKAYNYGSTYERWVRDDMIKALPDDLSKWPRIQDLISKVSNVDALRINGHLYGIPILNDISNPNKDFSNFTYVYRRDIAKAIDAENAGKAGYTPVYKEGDVYTWAEFDRLIKAFKVYAGKQKEKISVMVDEDWGFPSVTNFYKDVPHCFAKDETGKAINAFTSDKYIAGLEKAKEFVSEMYYSPDQFTFTANRAKETYLGGRAYILYDNYSLANYITLRKSFKKNNKTVNLDDGTALLKVMGPDGNFALEGTENWFSMTMFNYDIDNEKMEKILDIIDYLLTEEGTRLAIYGKEGYDYNIVDGKVELTEQGWEKGSDGQYGPKINGAKYLRYMATLGNDTKSYDPYTEMDAFNIINDWSNEMAKAKNAGKLRIVKEPADIDWMSTPTKNDRTESILADANNFALKYAFDELKTIEAYKAKFDEIVYWERILNEINEKLGK